MVVLHHYTECMTLYDSFVKCFGLVGSKKNLAFCFYVLVLVGFFLVCLFVNFKRKDRSEKELPCFII